MTEFNYRKIEFYLYNYDYIDKLIDEIKDDLINSINVSSNAWKKGITICNNTLENQVIKIIENRKILEFKRWQVLIKKVLAFLLKKYPKYYDLVKMKYLEKKSKDEIERALKFNFKKQKIIKDKLIEFIYKNAKTRNLI